MVRPRNPPWADLHPELLSAIADLLTSNPIDILAFRAVCKSWNFSSPSPSRFLLSLLLPLTVDKPAYSFDGRFHAENLGVPVISVTVVYAVRKLEDTKSWVLFADQLTPGKIMIRRPFCKCCYTTPMNFPRYLDVYDVHVDEIGRFYNLSFCPEVNKPPTMWWSEYVYKVVLNSDGSAAVALFRNGQLGMSKLRNFPNGVGGQWELVSSLGIGPDGRMDDVVSFDGRIYGVDRVGRLHLVGCGNSETREVVHSIDGIGGTKRKRLVESDGELYLVVKGSVSVGEESDGNVKFTVFGIDDENQWVEVYGIGGRVFFVGLDFSFSVSSHVLGGSFGTNCIIYSEGSFRDIDGGAHDDDEDDDIALFSNLKYGDLRVGVWHMGDRYHSGVIGSYPGYSSVLWPPPSWLWPNDMSKRLGDLEAALDNLLKDAPADKLEAMPYEIIEQVNTLSDVASQQNAPETWRLAHTMKVCVNKAKNLQRLLERTKTEVASLQQQSCKVILHQNHGGTFYCETDECQGSANLISETCDDFLWCQMNTLHGMILNFEEITIVLHNAPKPAADAVE